MYSDKILIRNRFCISAAPRMQTTTNTVILLYSRHCPGSIEWAKYLHKLFTELSKHKGKLRYVPGPAGPLKLIFFFRSFLKS